MTGLTHAQVKERIAKGQVNRTAKTKTKTIPEIFIENLFSVFNFIIGLIMLFFIAAYLWLGDQRLLLDSIGVFMVAFFNTVIAIGQEIKAKKALDQVNLLLKREVTVIREGQPAVIPHEALVLDDVIRIQRGDQAIADGRLLESHHLEIDESLLTGESVPIEKQAADPILSGSFCVAGHGYYVVEKVGDDSYAAQVTKLAKKYKFTLTPLQKRINLIVKALFAMAMLIVGLQIAFAPDADLHNVGFLRKIGTILMALVPQGLVLMSSVTFAIGVFRISRVGAIVQKLNAIESFASAQVICMDKTGTLTQNALTVIKVTPLPAAPAEADLHALLGTYAQLSSDKNATIRAIEVFAPDARTEVIDELPFSSEKKMSFLTLRQGDAIATYVLGAYDVLAEQLAEPRRQATADIFRERRLEVYRNLLFAQVVGAYSLNEIKADRSVLMLEPLCIVSITDQIRADMIDVIRDFQAKGIQFKILSGDAAPAIQAVCRAIGWELGDHEMIAGNVLEALAPPEFAAAVRDKKIFARLKPEHKLQIIKALRQQKIHTVMIGDGVNDLPAIKEADLGIAMEEGSAVTKEVADVVLLQNRFALLPEIFNEGNKIVNTVASIAKLFLTKNFLVIYISLLSLLLFLDFPLTPRRVSLINIFVITLPALMIALKNTNIVPSKRFMLELLTFVGLSALIMVSAGYFGFFRAQAQAGPSQSDAEMVMLSIMVVISVTNFFLVTIQPAAPQKWQFILYGGLLLGIFFTLVHLHQSHWLLNAIKTFYEIQNINAPSWLTIALISGGSSLLLAGLQMLRRRWLFGVRPQDGRK